MARQDGIYHPGALSTTTAPQPFPVVVEPILDSTVYTGADDALELPILIAQLRKALKDDGKCHRRDEEFLAKFLRVRGYDVQRAATSVRNYYRTLSRNRDIIRNIRPTQFTNVYRSNISVVLPAKCKLGTIVIFIQPGLWIPSKHSLHELLRAYLLLFEHTIQSVDMQLNGVSVIIDLRGLCLAHVLQLTPRHIKTLVFCAQDGLPLKLKGVHFINHPAIFSGVFYVAQKFLKEKLRQRIHFHSTPDTLPDHFHVEGLPKSIGGVLDEYDRVQKRAVDEILKNDHDFSVFYLPRENEFE